jgi:hypothetical protein
MIGLQISNAQVLVALCQRIPKVKQLLSMAIMYHGSHIDHSSSFRLRKQRLLPFLPCWVISNSSLLHEGHKSEESLGPFAKRWEPH